MYQLGGVGLGYFLTGKLGRAWVGEWVHGGGDVLGDSYIMLSIENNVLKRGGSKYLCCLDSLL